jgi:cardiolipin synthase (CMP-forming)
MTLPNLITLLRIAIIPWILILILRGSFGTALWLFLAAGLSDALDGHIARHFNQMSRLGSFLDPLADKLLLVGTFSALATIGMLPVWLAALVIARDLVILAGAAYWYFRVRMLEMEPTKLSKLNTGIMIMAVLLIIGEGAGIVRLDRLLNELYSVVVVGLLVSGGQYVVIWSRRLRQFPQGESLRAK